jgi:hypothetical protein
VDGSGIKKSRKSIGKISIMSALEFRRISVTPIMKSGREAM